ncbi:macro domain-containing protein [Halorussus salinisoli]|uniref:macro domain-containing protein n=1 Tax=Halorussus salinisoli TaxID=2558242 RepID=UPI002A90CEF4|nr:macro domain-containing protein [Halorussus salinisoli]
MSVVSSVIVNMDFIVIEGDIASQRADALVAASDTSLAMNGGTARALRDGGGEGIHEAAVERAPVDPGDVIITDSFNLPAEYVVHAAAKPATGHATEETVRAATRNALQTAEDHNCRSIVLPLLGSGVGGLDTETVADTMLNEINRFASPTLTDIRIIAYSADDRFRVQERADQPMNS